MAYFIRKEPIRKGKNAGDVRLRIVNSVYDPQKGYGIHRNHKNLGLMSELARQFEDPIAHFTEECEKLNGEAMTASLEEIDDRDFSFNVGCFLVDAMLRKMDAEKLIGPAFFDYRGKLKPYDVMADLILSRVVCPTSKRKAYLEVIPSLYKKYCEKASLDQIYDVLKLLGSQYIDVIDAYNIRFARNYTRDLDTVLFDGTNFFFEIDLETDFLKKGKSKEERKLPLLGMGLMLDAQGIPLMMGLYPGNEAEPQHAMSIVKHLNDTNILTRKMIFVADKAHLTGESVIRYTNTGYGFIISKSAKQLDKDTEKWMLEERTEVMSGSTLAYVEEYRTVTDSDGEVKYRYKTTKTMHTYEFEDSGGTTVRKEVPVKIVATYNPALARKKNAEISRQEAKARSSTKSQARKDILGDSGKYVCIKDRDGGKAEASVNEDMISHDRLIAGYNLLITTELDMDDEEIYSRYHELQEIERSFRLLKSQLEARPVYLSSEDAIKGHFLINYLSLFLLRTIQKKELKKPVSIEEMFDFIRKFNVAKDGSNNYICLAKKSPMTEYVKELTGLPSLRYPTKKMLDAYFTKFHF